MIVLTTIFKTGSTLTTASGSEVILVGGAQAAKVFWQVGSSATLGTVSGFAGDILAVTSITLDTGANLNGRVLALGGTATLDGNVITASGSTQVPDAGSTLLLFGLGVAALTAAHRLLRAFPKTLPSYPPTLRNF